MPRNDTNYPTIKRIIKKYGYSIFADPFTISFGGSNLEADLGIELLGAEKNNKRIVLELKSYTTKMLVPQYQRTFGQIAQYEFALARDKKPYDVYITIPVRIYRKMLNLGEYIPLLENKNIKYMVYNSTTGEIILWNPKPF